MQQLMTAGQAAKYLQVSRQTLTNWEKSGTIQTHRIGGIVRYLVEVPTAKEQQNAKKNS